ncbi:Ribosomal RNA adenine methylase transferase [Metarhizium album ARSEF 1941]|uniref:rRNA adenine N(6)-methyltransferase n=1 Tax=Metarhizium album (strain ARSEF 1941) TaxID=1081103 RepID=A0A0B2WWU5_METAS|nr:Ribosomal RNA adenine methylase transferase [Metarhizium album ARSEF 1941]KHN97330.1 Ribosomal RNA adenine methylase transferase [Metarhizium album ARSEF 1941]
MLSVTSDIARQLDLTGVWKRAGGRKKVNAMRAIEPRRVNIVSEALCDDIIRYIAPSLERHRGCDLVDLNPGVGVWSRKLHGFLEPRKHVMMDLDAELYSGFLTDLVSKDNVKLIAKSGLVWKDMLEMLHTSLSDQQQQVAQKDTPRRNDTLLVTANLSTFPKKAFHGFDSISSMILYQFISSIRTSTLFHRYGLIRMLIWVNDEDKRRLLPRSIHRRKRSAFEAEISCEWVHEVAGLDAKVQDRNALRDEWINTESAAQTLERMRAAGLSMPKGRETLMYSKLQGEPELLGQKLAGERPPSLTRPFKQELEELAQQGFSESAETSKRLKALRQREKYDQQAALMYLGLLQERDAVAALSASSPTEFERANAAWNEKIDCLKKNARNEFNGIRDSYHVFRQSPPAMLWDRRPYEPLSARGEEFFPNAPTALLDIQPKAMHPVFRQHGPNSSRSGDMSDVMLRFWLHHTLLPIQKAMEGLWGGFGHLITECPSVRDPSRGGTPMTGNGALTVRAMNGEQWAEIMEAWMNWPFMPSYTQMLGRLVEEVDGDGDEEDTKSGATGLEI